MQLSGVRLVNLPKVLDNRGNLTFIQKEGYFPFSIKRVFWIYDVPGGEVRGGHAYYEQYELVIALSGSFIVSVYDGTGSNDYLLNRSYTGLLIPNMIWRQMKEFSTNSLALVLSSHDYNGSDYIRDINIYNGLIMDNNE